MKRFFAILSRPKASNATLLIFAQVVGTGLGLFKSILMARLLGPTDYGLSALVIGYSTLLLSLISVKSISVTTRYIAVFYAKQQVEEVKAVCKLGFIVDFAVSVVTLIFVAITAPWAAGYILKAPDATGLIIIYTASLVGNSTRGTCYAILSALERFRLLAAFGIIENVIEVVVVLGVLMAGFGLIGVIVATAAANVLSGMLMLISATYILRSEGINRWWKASLASLEPVITELRKLLGWSYLASTASSLVAQLPLMMLGRLRGPEEAAYLRLSTNLLSIASYLESSLGRVVLPQLATRWDAGERQAIRASLSSWTLRAGLPAGAILLCAIAVLPYFVPLVFGAAYVAMIPGAQLILMGAAVSAVFFWLAPFYNATGRLDLWTKSYAVYAVLIVGLGWLCIQQWGFFGLAALSGLVNALYNIVMFRMVLKGANKDTAHFESKG